MDKETATLPLKDVNSYEVNDIQDEMTIERSESIESISSTIGLKVESRILNSGICIKRTESSNR